MTTDKEKMLPCPFCGGSITLHIGEPCGKEPRGSVSINHNCPSGLDVEYFEHGRGVNEAEAIKAWNTRTDKEAELSELRDEVLKYKTMANVASALAKQNRELLDNAK